MRKIEQEMLDAVKGKRDYFKDNTVVYFVSANESGNPNGSRAEISLHANHIADYWHESGTLEVDQCTLKNWPTNTTLSRLRALGANVYRKAGQVYLDEVPL